MRRLFLFLALLFLGCASVAAQVNPRDFGWKDALSGVKKAEVLYNAHQYAVQHDTYVDYSGLKVIDIEITKNFKSIPLTSFNDFSGVTFNVKNTGKDVPLFTMTQKATKVSVAKGLLDGNDFRSIPALSKGEYVLIIQDKNPWVDQRVGHTYSHIRKDVLWIKDGKSTNRVISSYNTPEADPVCSFCKVTSPRVFIGNFVLNRAKGSTKRTDCVLIQGAAHIRFENIQVNTPESEIVHDATFKVEDCVDVSFENITINGTYSKSNSFGYAFNFNNVWNTSFVRVNGRGEWGVMGHNNMSDTYLSGCNINRFDIHCYGRNLYLSDCVIDGGEKGWFCGGSGIYGTIKYDRCQFVNANPIYYGDSYKTYVGAHIVLNDCVFDVTSKKNAVFYTRVFNNNMNPRKGLTQKCLPNIEINNLTINVPKGVRKVFLMNLESSPAYSKSIGYIDHVTINGLIINSQDAPSKVSFSLCNVPIITDREINVSIDGMQAPGVVTSLKMSSNHVDRIKIKKSEFSVKEDYKEGSRVRSRRSKLSIVK